MGGLAKKLLGTGKQEKLYVDDVFSTYLYTGNGSTQTITNGIDLAGEGGLVWIKGRSNADDHCLADTTRGVRNTIKTNTTGGSTAINSVIAFNSDGFTAGNDSNVNASSHTYASWTFLRAPKFFDVVTYTGNGMGARQIPHKLGVAPGMVIIKRTDSDSDWIVAHRHYSFPQQEDGTLRLNKSDAVVFDNSIQNISIFTTHFTLAPATYPNTVNNVVGATYVAYLFAHDPDPDGIIQCGSFTTSGGAATVNLGWEPQYLMFKRTDSAGEWFVMDTMRGWTNATAAFDATLQVNTPNAEQAATYEFGEPSTTGMQMRGLTASGTFIYLAIRRPNKPPKTGAEVLNITHRTTAVTSVTTGFPVDTVLLKRSNVNSPFLWFDRLRSVLRRLRSDATNEEAEQAGTLAKFDISTGFETGTNSDAYGTNTVSYAFRRAPGFFDVVCFQGNGSIPSPGFDHNLGVPPEFVIIKRRDTSTFGWPVYVGLLGETQLAYLNRTDRFSASGVNWLGAPTATKFFPANFADGGNASSLNYVAYLFASLPGISKVGSYTGNGGTQIINCGFTTGARFILVKRTDSPGDWYVWDTARGIIAANDPHLSLNTTAAEVTTDDSVDPAATGFIVNQNTATNINVNGASYIFLAIA